MKTQTSRRQDGFTLVELLVVIAIIAVLAGAGFAAGSAAIQKAKKTTTLATCTSIESAVNNFYTEYGSMPKDAMVSDTKVDSKDKPFLNALLGLETGSTIMNTRGIKFLSVREGKSKGTGGTNGLVYSGATIVGIFDPWGGLFSVMLDGDYDEKITVQTAAASAAKILNGRRCAAWSNGADCVSGTGGKVGDDVITWNP